MKFLSFNQTKLEISYDIKGARWIETDANPFLVTHFALQNTENLSSKKIFFFRS